MGKLNTTLGLPRKILLQGWAGDQGNADINGEYTFYYNTYFTNNQILKNIYLNLNKISPSGGILDSQGVQRPAIYFFPLFGGYWIHDSNDPGWLNSSTNPNTLPLIGWEIDNANGAAGTITILENISAKNSKISIKKQNLGGGKINTKTFRYELIMNILPANEIYKFYFDDPLQANFYPRDASLPNYLEVILENDVDFWAQRINFRNKITETTYFNFTYTYDIDNDPIPFFDLINSNVTWIPDFDNPTQYQNINITLNQKY